MNANVMNNKRKFSFMNGEMNNDELECHVIGIWGAYITLSLDGCQPSTSN